MPDMEIRERITRNETRLTNIECRVDGGEESIKRILASRGFSLKKIGAILAAGTMLLGGVTWAQNAYFQNQNDKRYIRPYQIAGQITQDGLSYTLDVRELDDTIEAIALLQDKKRWLVDEFTRADEFALQRLFKKKESLELKLKRGRQ